MKTIVAIFAFIATSAFAQFDKANQEFSAGDFKSAVADYETLARNGEYSANLFYDLGNAYFRTQDFGRAILNYERAVALDRHQAEAQANLHVARDAARALQMPPAKIARIATVNEATIVAAICGWLFLFSLLFARRRGAIALSILSLSIFALAGFAAYRMDSAEVGRAIVVARDVTARVATADNASRVLALPVGSEIEIVSKRGDWIYATLPNDSRGWIPATAAESVRL